MVGLLNLNFIFTGYIPHEAVKEKRNAIYDTLLTMLAKGTVSKDAIVDQLFSFLESDQNIIKAREWLERSTITIDGQQVYKLQKKQKHSIVRQVFRSKSIQRSDKFELLELTLG